MTEHITGLTESEVQARRARGDGNNVSITTGRTYREIVISNIFNLINIVLFIIGAVMISIGRYTDAFVSVGLIAMNVVVGMWQEIRAKRQLDEIALLTRPNITVRRDGTDKVVDPSDLVLGDMILIEPGDQIMVDGVMVSNSRVELDESQLTGESDLIPKTAGDEVLSGSYVVTGKGMYEATRVGAASFANKLTANARKFELSRTPLQRDIDFIIRLLAMLAGFVGFLLLISAILQASPLMRTVQMTAVVAGLIPNGLFFMVIVAYALGALRIVQRGALIQQANSVESLSNVNVLCMDKTGTLTANKINYNDLRPLDMDKVRVQKLLADFARSASVTNRTGEAIVSGLAGEARTPVDEVTFSSARKWSALVFDDEDMRGVYVLGAAAMLQRYLPPDTDLEPMMKVLTEIGMRVLLFAYSPDVTPLYNDADQPQLPPLTPLGLVSFSDELRPHLKETLRGFIKAGVDLKIISGDNPDTVAALAKQAGLPGDIRVVSGPQLDGMDDPTIDKIASDVTVFGRITPEQKERLVDALRRQKKYVAMIGDGVNDVLSLKKADIGIAMESGSSATRGVADIVLLGDSFGALPPAFLEGQRIINGMQDILRLFLTRTTYVALLVIATAIIGARFPFIPTHVSLLVTLTIAIPTFALAVWARPGNTRQQGLLRSITHFVMPAAFTIFFFGLLIYIGALSIVVLEMDAYAVSMEEINDFVDLNGIDYMGEGERQLRAGYLLEYGVLAAQTALTTFTILAGLLLIVFVEPPIHWWVGGDQFSGDWRPTRLAAGLLVVFMLIKLIPFTRNFFILLLLPWWAYALLIAITGFWALIVRHIWRNNILGLFLGLPPLRTDIDLSPTAEKKMTLATQQVGALEEIAPPRRTGAMRRATGSHPATGAD